jgi:hypothetical protein
VALIVLRRRFIKPGMLVLLIITLTASIFVIRPQLLPALANRSEMEGRLREIFKARALSLFNGNYAGLEAYYDTDSDAGRFALNHEVGRIKYFREWVKQRQVTLTGIKLDLAIVDAGVEGEEAWASVSQHMIIGYQHQGEAETVINELGLRTIHWVDLERQNDEWVISLEWYWDPFEIHSLEPEVAPGTARCSLPLAPPPQGQYNRERAVAYADRYSGVRYGPGDGRYNKDYGDYTGLGGDCANFASQVLSDARAGGIPPDWNWSEGSVAWLQAEALIYYLLDNGLAVRVMRGSFTEVTAVTEEYAQGAVNVLQPGDIIGYEEKGEIGHVSVVAGRDSGGYVLVNSHTADRYHMPWDLGWDKYTTYWLLQVVY